MKPCHDNNAAAIYAGRAATVHNPLFQLSRLNILTGTILLVSCSNTFQNLVVCALSKPKMLTKHITKKFVRLHNHCLL